MRTLHALFGAPLATRASRQRCPAEREEEEEEEETELPQKQRITLRVGMFFDGTLNNLPNASPPPNAAAKTWPNSAPTASKPSPASASPTATTTATAMRSSISDPTTATGMSRAMALLFLLYKDDQRESSPAPNKQHQVYIEGLAAKLATKMPPWEWLLGKGKPGCQMS